MWRFWKAGDCGERCLIGIVNKIKERLGPLWWYMIILFCVQRVGDVINMVIGVYVIPKYVPQEELGAVLPLTKVGALLVLPLSILLLTFKKFLNKYAVHEEVGKIKRLLLDMFMLSAVLSCAALLYARFFMPFLFERMRVADGRLGILIVASGIIGVVAPVFSSTLEALKRFQLIAVVQLLSAPLRLATLLICMPIRALSGYFMGQIVPDLFSMGLSLWRLIPLLSSKIKSVPYWKTDGMAMLRYTGPIAMYSVFGMLVTVAEAFVIRHRLPDIESAGYYMISRFAEIGNYLGNSVILVLFPLVAERFERGQKSFAMLNQSLGVILAGGVALATAFQFFGRPLFSVLPDWGLYVEFVPQMVLLTVIISLRSATGCYMTHEMACARFGYIYYCSGLHCLEVCLLYGVTGYTFFKPYVPEKWIVRIAELNPGRLDFILQVMCVFSVLNVVGIAFHRRYFRKSKTDASC